MKARSLLFAVIACTSVSADLRQDLLEELKGQIKSEARAAREKGDERHQQEFYRMQELLMRLQQGDRYESDGDGGLLQAVEALGTLSTSESIDQICKTLTTELRAQQEKREHALIAELEKTLGDSLRATLAAKSAKDVDGPLAAVGKLARESEARNARNPKLRVLVSQAQQLWEFIRQWQDYLAETDSGDTEGARQKLQNLVSAGRDFSGFMPRSELLARLNEIQKTATPGQTSKASSPQEVEQRVREIILKTETLEGLPGAISELERITQRSTPNSGQTASTIQALQAMRSLHRNYHELKKGLAVNISLASLANSSSFDGGESISHLRSQLVLFALPRTLGVSESAQPHPGENILTFLQRMLEEGRQKENWVLVGRILDVAQTLSLTAIAASMDRTALQSFLAARNQERARQYALAVSSYQAALKTGSQLLSAEKIGDHLEVIRKEHPQEFEQGVQLALNPPLPADPRAPTRPGYPVNFPYSSTFPGRSAVPESPPALSVPAAPKPEEPAKPSVSPGAGKPK